MDEAYRQMVDAFGRGWERGDVDELVSVFAPDAVFLETPFSERAVGIDAIRAYWKDVPLNQAEVSFKSGEVYVAGPWFAIEFRCLYPNWGADRCAGGDVLRDEGRQDHGNEDVLAPIGVYVAGCRLTYSSASCISPACRIPIRIAWASASSSSIP